jgi:arginase
MPGGLGWRELVTILRLARESPRVAGVEVTIYNPKLDPTRSSARGLVDALVHGLAPGA